MSIETEEEFISRMDAPFDLKDKAQFEKDLAASLKFSDNATFMVIFSLLLNHDMRFKRLRKERWEAIDQAFQHPLKDDIRSIIETKLIGGTVPDNEIEAALQKVRDYPHQWNALNICKMDCCSEQIDDLSIEIGNEWYSMDRGMNNG